MEAQTYESASSIISQKRVTYFLNAFKPELEGSDPIVEENTRNRFLGPMKKNLEVLRQAGYSLEAIYIEYKHKLFFLLASDNFIDHKILADTLEVDIITYQDSGLGYHTYHECKLSTQILSSLVHKYGKKHVKDLCLLPKLTLGSGLPAQETELLTLTTKSLQHILRHETKYDNSLETMTQELIDQLQHDVNSSFAEVQSDILRLGQYLHTLFIAVHKLGFPITFIHKDTVEAELALMERHIKLYINEHHQIADTNMKNIFQIFEEAKCLFVDVNNNNDSDKWLFEQEDIFAIITLESFYALAFEGEPLQAIQGLVQSYKTFAPHKAQILQEYDPVKAEFFRILGKGAIVHLQDADRTYLINHSYQAYQQGLTQQNSITTLVLSLLCASYDETKQANIYASYFQKTFIQQEALLSLVQQYGVSQLRTDPQIFSILKSTLHLLPSHLTYTRALCEFLIKMTQASHLDAVATSIEDSRYTIYALPYHHQQVFFDICIHLQNIDDSVLIEFVQFFAGVGKKYRKNFLKYIGPILANFLHSATSNKYKKELWTGITHSCLQQIQAAYHMQQDIRLILQELTEQLRIYIQEYYSQVVHNTALTNIIQAKDLQSQILQQFLFSFNHKSPETDAALGLMLYLRETNQRDAFRKQLLSLDTLSVITDEGKELIKNFIPKALPEIDECMQSESRFDFSLQAIEPHTSLLSMRRSFIDLLDPDLYQQNTAAHELATHFIGVETFSEIHALYKNYQAQNSDAEMIVKQIPVLYFLQQIEALQLGSLASIASNSISEYTILQTIQKAQEVLLMIHTHTKTQLNNELLTIRIEEISQHFGLDITEDAVRYLNLDPSHNKDCYTLITNDLAKIVPNIRGCLACLRKEVNNHRITEFLWPNRFALLTYEYEEHKNISDQFLIQAASNYGDCLVLDTLYGLHTPQVLLNNINAVIDKLVKNNLSISLFIPTKTIQSAGSHKELFSESLTGELPKGRQDLLIDDMELTKEQCGYNEIGEGKEGILIVSLSR